jgi:hypothetical protein
LFPREFISCNRRSLAVLCWVALTIGAPGRAIAQEATDPAQTARFRLGPLRFTPSISLTSLGVDNNVFNEVDNPKNDNTAALGPAVDYWMNVGRSRISGKAATEYLYFQTYANQRAWNTQDTLKWAVPLTRLTPFVTGSYANTRTRAGYEIDSRVRQEAQRVGAGAELKLSGRTVIVMSGDRSWLRYDDSVTYLGTQLAAVLNRWTNSEQLMVRYRLTALTTFVVNAEALQDRFEADRPHNANSIKVLPGFEMKPSALVAGKVFVGVRRFVPMDRTMPEYQGPVASVDATFTRRATQLNLKVDRDVVFSYQPTQPYYTLTDSGLIITERLTPAWDVVVRGSRQLLDYRRVVSLDEVAPQVDTIRQYGGGVGYRFGRTLRLGVDALYYRRSTVNGPANDYEGMRAGVSVVYGLPQ